MNPDETITYRELERALGHKLLFLPAKTTYETATELFDDAKSYREEV